MQCLYLWGMSHHPNHVLSTTLGSRQLIEPRLLSATVMASVCFLLVAETLHTPD